MSLPVQQPKISQKHQQVTQNPSKAVQYVCRLLRSYGVDQLSPELVRQAKFDAPTSCQPLLLACHDVALLVLAGFPPKCAEALTKLKQQLQQDALQEAAPALSQPGLLLLLHCLSDWGCPAGLIAQLTLPQPSSRSALLALTWLIAHARLFDKALEQLQIPQQLLPLLPPYPEDTRLLADAQSQFTAAATAAQQHHEHIQQLIQQQVAAASSTTGAPGSSRRAVSSSGCWPAVHIAAHHVLATYRSATLRLQQLTCWVEAREKLLHDIQQVQLQQQPTQQQGRAAGQGPTVLTAFELHLLSHPALLLQHQEALAQAVSLLQQQDECRQHAAVFFAWVTSAVAEVQHQLQGHAAAASSNSSSSGSSTASKATASRQQQRQQQQGRASSEFALPAAPMQDLMPLVQQLPAADTQLAAGVLVRMQIQLQAAAAAAGIALGPSGSSAAAAAEEPTTQLGAVDLAGGLGNLPASPPPLPPPQQQQQQQQQQAIAATRSCAQAAAVAMVQAGTVPAVHIQELQSLPEDLQHSLQQLQVVQNKKQHQRREQLAALQEVQQCCSLHRRWVDPLTKALKQHQQQQQQQQMTGVRSVPGLAAVQALGGAMPMGAASARQNQLDFDAVGGSSRQQQAQGSRGTVDVSEELQRLKQLALHVAKALARTRAGNKQQLAAAAQMLLETGEESGGGQLVLYQS